MKKSFFIKYRYYLIIGVILIVTGFYFSYRYYFAKQDKPEFITPFLNVQSVWVDSLVENMSLEEKVGQLIMLENSKQSSVDVDSIKLWINKFFIGGLILESDSLKNQVLLTNKFQSYSKTPLLIGMQTKDAYADFLKDIISFPTALTIDAVSNDSLLDVFRNIIVQQNKLLGVHINFSVSIEKSKYNNDSLFEKRVLQKALKFTSALQKEKILASLNNLEMFANINDDSSANYKKHIYPYEKLINSGLSCILINNKNNNDELKNYLNENLNFYGLVFSRANTGSIENSFNSGADILIVNDSVQNIVAKIKKLIDEEIISIEEIDRKVRKILSAKSWVGLENYQKLNVEDSEKKIKNDFNLLFKRNLIESSITLVKNKNGIIPFSCLADKQFFIANVGKNNLPDFVDFFNFYSPAKTKKINPETKYFEYFIKNKKDCNPLIITLNDIKIDTILHRKFLEFLEKSDTLLNLIVVNFKNPDNLKYIQKLSTIIQLYDNSEIEQQFAAQLLFGGISAKGILPYSISDSLILGQGVKTCKTRLKYTIPEDAGINSLKLSKIDSIALEGITLYAIPGCQVWVAKDGKVIYNKAFGHHTYNKEIKVKYTDLYDIASVTKVAATTIATMKMYDGNKINLYDNLEEYFKNTKIDYTKIKADTIIKTDTVNINEIENFDTLLTIFDTIHLNDTMIVKICTLYYKVTPKLNIFKAKPYDLLIHKSGLAPSLPILPFILYRHDTVFNDGVVLNSRKDSVKYLFNKYYSRKYIKDSATVQIAKSLFMKNNWFDSLWIFTKQIRLYSSKVYQYSDVNMILLQQTIDTINQVSLDKYMSRNFYKPLGLQTICYHPLEHFDENRIIPTAIDKYWREQLIHGHVHDPSAALLGGVSGNAGIFTNANDLGVLFEMLRKNGKYGGERFLNSSTVKRFVSTQPGSHRGLGFDKNSSFMADSASVETFGHTGFTGACVWVDPENNLVYVFLSNRVNPNVKNWKLNTYKIRQRIHQAVYDAMEK